MNKNLPIIACIVLLFHACSSSRTAGAPNSSNPNTLSATERSEGFRLLFDGKTTNGWHTYGRQDVGQAWKIADGTLYFDTTRVNGRRIGGGDLVTNDEFENFHLKLEWKIAPAGNSGIIFLVHEDTTQYRATYQTGPEMQVIDNNGHADAKINKHRAGDLYDLVASAQETVRPLTDWNLAEIRINNGKLDLFLNGTNVVSTNMWDQGWSNLVANSKFRTWAGFAKYRKGKIALQDHGNAVWFRNIRIKTL